MKEYTDGMRRKNREICLLPQLDDIPPPALDADMGAGPSSPGDMLGVSSKPLPEKD